MNYFEKYAAKNLLVERLIAKAIKRDASLTKRLPDWARKHMYVDGGLHKVKKWPKDPKFLAKIEMLQSGKQNTGLFSGPPHRKPGSGRPEGGWPEGSIMARWRRLAGRKQS